MNKTIDINLSGRMFHVDEDAYKLLYDYLYNLRHAFEHQEGCNEIMDDLENRLAELLIEHTSGRQEVVSLAIVEKAIGLLGKPEEIAGGNEPELQAEEQQPKTEASPEAEKEPEEEPETEAPKDTPPPEEPVRKRLFRNPDDRMLGGVLGGLAVYLNWDPTLLRLLMVVILFAGYGTVIPIYVICWLVIPKAVTATDKLHMQGRPVTMENIGKMVTGGIESAGEYLRSDKPRTTLQRLADGFVAIVGFLLKAALVIVALCCSPLLLLLLILFIAFIVTLCALLFGGAASLYPLLNEGYFIGTDMAGITWNLLSYLSFTLGGILLLSCFTSGVCTVAFHWKGFSPRTMKVLLALSVVCLVIGGACFALAGFRLYPPQSLIQLL